MERRRCSVVKLQRIGCAQASAFSGSPVRPEALLPARPNVDGLHHLRNGTQIVSHLTQGPVIPMSMDPTIIEESELPEYFEACVRTELSYWLRNTQVSRVARAQVMRRIGPLPDGAPAAGTHATVAAICYFESRGHVCSSLATKPRCSGAHVVRHGTRRHGHGRAQGQFPVR